MLRKDYARAPSRTIRSIIAFTDPVESVAGRNDPGIGDRALQIFPEILEDGWMFGRDSRKVVQGFVDSGGQACSGYIMPEDAVIHHLREKAGLRSQLTEHVGDILLTLRCKGLLIAGSAAEGYDDDFSLFRRHSTERERTGAHQSGSQRKPGGAAQEVAPREGKLWAGITEANSRARKCIK